MDISDDCLLPLITILSSLPSMDVKIHSSASSVGHGLTDKYNLLVAIYIRRFNVPMDII
jgi:hypothetical protein